ncbi:hypothetical protein HHK36_007237 [Tetracentron sinense]|uniref:Uncharacterized protein n=1 Tax=Tetracentron sinense TaxID=13715 RepID=A0A834ZRB6_TETSI|nr:hypothetical protein HHK36_007237 [Tetracentron sinense]
MPSTISTSIVQSSILSFSDFPRLSAAKTLAKRTHPFLLKRSTSLSQGFSLRQSNQVFLFQNERRNPILERGLCSICFYNAKEESENNLEGKETKLDWPILKRWDVPWKWQTVALTMIACGLSFVLTGLVEAAVVPFLGLQIGALSLDEKAEILFIDQTIATAVVLGVVYGLTNTFQPLPDDLFRYGIDHAEVL